ncbi:SGNH/GDSL hydrolase family protein [Dyadobacter alkalitolerans]|uniref:SGNH/GDSL hydrolase family protein n=1 Tax=Dyadobacter alkalitolerans TaxID=492736 RepID=UPI0012F90B26|nr:SGNH/GDSL hydrolase family protein [Dyadobacter alkalitolerans]
MGNSITVHGSSPSIGWYGDWGMAASAQAKDFVHVLKDSIRNKRSEANISYFNIANSFEKVFWKMDTTQFREMRQLSPDLIILKIGENIDKNLAIKNSLALHLELLVDFIAGDKRTKVCLVGSFWPNPEVDNIFHTVCQKNGWSYVDLNGIYENQSENTAINIYTNPQVGKHPSDKGMQLIADRIWKGIGFFLSRN